MVLTIPFETGVFAAFIFLAYELLVFPVLMYFTSTLAAVFIIRRAKKAKCIHIRSIAYPFWNDGLLAREPAHLFLFLLRVTCVIIPVYLETRFVSRSTPVQVSKLLRNAFVPNPKDLDGNFSEENHPFLHNSLVQLEAFSRCSVLHDNGWVTAKIANITVVRNQVQTISCVPGTDQVLYRTIGRPSPVVNNSVVERTDIIGTTPARQTNFTLQVVRAEGPFREFPPWPGLEFEEEDSQFIQVRNVTVLDSRDIECFSWRSPVPDSLPPIWKYLAGTFVCQRVKGSLVDFYFASILDMTNENNTRVLSKSGNIIMKQFTVRTSFNLVGTLEFRGKIMINAGNIIRRVTNLVPPITTQTFPHILRRLLYTRTSNVTIEVPGDEEAHSVELDRIVLVVGAMEVVSILVLGMVLAILSRYKWKDMQIANMVEGLSHIWAENRSCFGGCPDNVPITLRLKRRRVPDRSPGEHEYIYEAVDVESGEIDQKNDDMDDERSS